jgi:hypothetical protein
MAFPPHAAKDNITISLKQNFVNNKFGDWLLKKSGRSHGIISVAILDRISLL